MQIDFSVKHGSSPVNFIPSPIVASWVLEGDPVARLELLSTSADGTASTFIWDCTEGRFNWFYTFDETLYVLEGSATLKTASGNLRHIVAGDTVFFPAGSRAEWTVNQYIRKLAFCRTSWPTFLIFARSFYRRLKGLVQGAKKDDASGML